MPIYDYKCVKCSHIEEVLTNKIYCDEMMCPKCGAIAKKEFPKNTRTIFNGGNWAKDGYGS